MLWLLLCGKNLPGYEPLKNACPPVTHFGVETYFSQRQKEFMILLYIYSLMKVMFLCESIRVVIREIELSYSLYSELLINTGISFSDLFLLKISV